jgi:hypothetical protein
MADCPHVEFVRTRMFGLTAIGNGASPAGTRMQAPPLVVLVFVDDATVDAIPVEAELPRNSHEPASADTIIRRVFALRVYVEPVVRACA